MTDLDETYLIYFTCKIIEADKTTHDLFSLVSFLWNRAGVKSAIVLLPLLGITWLFGVLTFNSDTLAFQYLFAIFSSLQVCSYADIVTIKLAKC